MKVVHEFIARLNEKYVGPIGVVRRGNCFLVVLKWLTEGGSLWIKRSVSNLLIPHVFWTAERKITPDTVIWHFQPVERRWGWRAFTHAFFFEGMWVCETQREQLARIERERRGK